MGLAGMWIRRTVRRQGASLVGAVVLLAVVGGLGLFALAGARRTQSAYPRFLRSVAASTMAVDTGAYDPERVAAIAAYPEVVGSRVYIGVAVARIVDGEPEFGDGFEAEASVDGRFFDQDRFTPTTGRLADPRRVDEIVLNEAAAEELGAEVGDVLTLGTWDPADFSEDFFEHPTPPAFTTRATVVGTGVFPNEVVQDDTDRAPRMLLTPAYAAEAAPYAMYEWQGLELRRGDADVPAVKRRILSRDDGGLSFFRQTSAITFHTQQSMLPISVALGGFGTLAVLACLVMVGQLLVRGLQSERADRAVLRALGTTRGGSTGAALGAPVAAVALGAVLAGPSRLALSPLMPIGRVRDVETARGLDVDWTVVGLGAVVLATVLTGLVAWAAWRAAPRPDDEEASARLRRSRLARAAEAAGIGRVPVTGIRLALEPGRGATSVPVRSVVAGVVVAVVALVGALTFGTGVRELVDQPRLFGWDWDAAILMGSGYGQADPAAARARFADDPGITEWSGAYFGTGDVDGRPVPFLGFEPGSTVHPPIVEGRFLRAADEIVLGARTLEALGVEIGERVTVGRGPEARRVRVVGTATLPTVGVLHGTYPSLGVGALVDYRLVPNYDVSAVDEGFTGPNLLLIRTAADAPAGAQARLARHAEALGEADQDGAAPIPVQRPAEVVNADDIGSLPTVMAALLAAGALTALALGLGSSVRRRRHDLALLKTLGFTRKEIGAAVAWQALVTVGIGLAVGIPVGLVVGRVAWARFAGALDVVPQGPAPWLAVIGVSMGALVVGFLAAAVPARVARRTRPAVVLRAE